MANPRQEDIDFLIKNPHQWRKYEQHFGTLPEGFSRPAPTRADLDYVLANPDKAARFEESFGMRPDAAQAAMGAQAPAQAQAPVSPAPPPDDTSVGEDAGRSVMRHLADVGGSTVTFGRKILGTLANPARFGAQTATDIARKQGTAVDPAITDLANQPSAYDKETAFERAAASAEASWREGMSEEAQAAIKKQLFERSDSGGIKLGEGASDPLWWMDTAIGTAANMAPGITIGAKTARATYTGVYADRLAFAAASGADAKIAARYAQREATKAAQKAAVIAGGLSEGALAGGQVASQVEETITGLDEETLNNYEPYRGFREQGLSHEAARERVASDSSLQAAAITAVASGLAGIPAQKLIGKWVSADKIAASRVGAAVTGAAAEGAQEFVQEGSTALAQNWTLRPITGQDLWEGVLEGALTGFVVGGALGGTLGAAAGTGKKEQGTTETRKLAKDIEKFRVARENLEAAKNPRNKVKAADVQATKEAYGAALATVSQGLLKSGKLNKETQKAVADSLAEARAMGIEVQETTDGNQSLKPLKGNEAGAGKAPVEAGAAGAGTAEVQALNETETAQLETLNKVAGGEQIEGSALEQLVSNKLARVSKEGRPVLLPAARKLRTDLTARATAAETKPEAKPEAKPAEAAKPKDANPKRTRTEAQQRVAQKKMREKTGTPQPKLKVAEVTDKVLEARVKRAIEADKEADAAAKVRERDAPLQAQKESQTQAEKDAALLTAPKGKKVETAIGQAMQDAIRKRNVRSIREQAKPAAEATTQDLTESAIETPKRTPAERRVDIEDGFAFRKPSGKIKFRHYSNLTDDDVTLDPEFKGTGLAGRERARGGPKTVDLYAYDMPDREVEGGLANKTEYEVEVDADDLYDIDADPEGIRAQVGDKDEQGYPHTPGSRAAAYTAAIEDAGYKGFIKTAEPYAGQARMFRKVPAKKRVRDVAADIAASKPQHDTKQFKDWFKNSWVVNEDGSPKVVYHGTSASFPSFGSGTNFFTSDPEVASDYARARSPNYRGEGSNLVPVYLSMQNPLILNRDGGSFSDIPLRDLPNEVAAKLIYQYDVANHNHQAATATAAEVAKSAYLSGYDGVVFTEMRDGIWTYSEDTPSDVYVTFSPKQSKSAVGNSGAFDPKNADLAARRGTGKGSMSTKEIEDATALIRDHLGFGIQIVADASELPVPLAAQKWAEDAEGLFKKTPFGGDVYLVRGNIRNAAHARTIAAHEIVGHHGLRGLLGDQYGAVMDKILRTFPKQCMDAAKRNGLDIAGAPTDEIKTQRLRLAAEEVIAYASERVLSKDISAESDIWSRILRAVRGWLRDIGIMKEMSNEAVLDLIYDSRDWVRSNAAKRQRDLVEYYARVGREFTFGEVALRNGERLYGMEPTVEIPGMGTIEVGPFHVAREVARQYMEDQGLPYVPITHYVKQDPQLGKRIADAYLAIEHNPKDPEVAAAYDAFIKETIAQWHAIMKTDLKVEFIEPGMDDPYAASPRLAVQDIINNNHMWVYPSESGFGDANVYRDHPMLQPTEVSLGGKRMLANDVFRVVHDYFGHAKEGNGFRASGEYNAWRGHVSMYSPTARRAMTKETLGETSTANFGPNGDFNRTARGLDVMYPTNKAGLLPEEFSQIDDGEMESAWSMPQRNIQTQTPEFKAWFGKSKVVTDRGEPRVLYHGSKKEFSVFGVDGRGDGAIFMTSEPLLASEYAGGARMDVVRHNAVERSAAEIANLRSQDDRLNAGMKNQVIREYNVSPNVMPVYVKMENPAIVKEPKGWKSRNNMKVQPWDQIPRAWLPKDISAEFEGYAHGISTDRVAQYAAKLGYDGVIFSNIDDGIGAVHGVAADIFVSFASRNIKSAVGNVGTFNPHSGDIAARKPTSNEEARATVAKIAKHLTPAELAKLNRATAQKVVDLFAELPSDAEMAAVALAGKAKRGWYKQSAEAIVNVFGTDAPRFVALLAALSPQTSVESNLSNALAVWRGWLQAGRPTDRASIVRIMGENVQGSKLTDSVLPAWINNSERALTNEAPDTVVLSGPKVNSFAANLRGETNSVTLDAWMATYARIDQTLFKGKLNAAETDPGKSPGYLAYSARVRQAAKRLSKMTGETWTPAEVQETIWSWSKALYETTTSYGSMATAKELVESKELTDDLINATPDFATLFTQEEHRRVLTEAGYAEQLAGGDAAGTAQSGSEVEAGTSPEPDRRALIRAAERLDAVRRDRAKAAANKADEAADYAFSKPVKLGGPRHPANVTAFMEEYFKGTHPHPFMSKDRLVGNGTNEDDWAIVELRPTGDRIHISAIQSLNPGQKTGAASRALDKIISIADKHGVTIDLTPKAYGTAEGRLTNPQLKKWYARHGFVPEKIGGAMVREPQKSDDFAASKPQQSTPEFKKWFEGSKVVNDDGSPKVLYHGTRGPLSKFSAKRTGHGSTVFGNYKVERAGIFMAESADLANEFAMQGENRGGQQITPLYATISNPLDFTNRRIPSDALFNSFSDAATKLGFDGESYAMWFHNHWGHWDMFDTDNGNEADGFVAVLKSMGYDGVIIDETSAGDMENTRTWVAFDPQQVKSAVGNSGAFDPDSDDFAAAFGGVPTGGNQDLESFLSKIGAKPVSLKQRFKEFSDGILDKFVVAAQDHFYGIQRAENLAGIAIGDSGYMSARLSTGAASLMRATLEDGYPEWDSTNLQQRAPRIGGNKGFFDIIKPLGGDVNTWLAWMVARRADRLMTEGRENLFTQDEINAALQLGNNNPLFNQVASEYAQFKTKLLDFAEQAGIIDPTTRPLWDNADHIPFYRLMENGAMKVGGAGGGLGFVKNQIKKLKGGQANLGDPLENIMKNWSNLIEASVRAHAAQLTVDNLDGTGLVVKIPSHGVINITQADAASFLANNPRLVQDLQSIGLNPVATDPATLAAIQQMFGTKAPEGDDIVSVWRAGKREHWRVNDDLLFRSLQAVNPTVWGAWMNIFRKPKRLLTETITIVPEFGVKNFWRDMWGVFVQGKNDGTRIPIIPIYDSVRGAVKYAMRSDTAKDLMAGGASFEGTGSNEQTAAQAARRSAIMAGQNVGSKIINTPAKAYLLYRDLMSAAENAHRVAVYDRTLAQGGTRKSALFEAKDLMDFSMRGNSAVARFLVESVPFWGARVAGLTTLGRRIVRNPAGVMLRGMLLVAASAALLALNYDDERYKQLTLDQKNLYWHVFIGDAHIRIPKPFEVGTLFGTIPEAIGDALFTNADEPDRMKQSAQMVSHAFTEALDLSPQVGTVWPVVELAMNKNSFTGAPILNLADQGKLPEDQDSPSVRPTYRALSRMMPEGAPDALRSPKQLQHLGKAYIGTLQDYVLAVTDKIARAGMGEPQPPENDSGDKLFLRSFVDRGPARSTKYMNTMYEVADEAEQVNRSLTARLSGNESDIARGEELLTDEEDLIVARQPFSDAVTQVSDIRKAQRSIQMDRSMSPADKKTMIDELQETANSVAASVWDFRPGGKMSPSVAAKLMGTTRQEQVRTLREAGMPDTADLLNSLRAAP
jgi:hypothetical protein